MLKPLIAILLAPVYLLVGVILSEWIAALFDLWYMYVAAIILPFVGLIGTYLTAPCYKAYAVSFMYVAGLLLAYLLVFPVHYPEGVANAYQLTYRPFFLTLVWATCLLVFLMIRIRQKKY